MTTVHIIIGDNGGGGSVTPGGVDGDLQINSSGSLDGLSGDDGDTVRYNQSAGRWEAEPAVEIPAGSEDDVIGLDGAGGLKNLGPMTGGGGSAAGDDGYVQLSDGAGNFVASNSTAASLIAPVFHLGSDLLDAVSIIKPAGVQTTNSTWTTVHTLSVGPGELHDCRFRARAIRGTGGSAVALEHYGAFRSNRSTNVVTALTETESIGLQDSGLSSADIRMNVDGYAVDFDVKGVDGYTLDWTSSIWHEKAIASGDEETFDLTSIAWTGYWIDYGGSAPWVGTATTGGSSGSHDLIGPPSTTDDPSAGSTLNGHSTADFDGSNDSLVADTATHFGDYVDDNALYVAVVFNADTADTDAGTTNRKNDPHFISDVNEVFGFGFNSAGLFAHGTDTGATIRDVAIACATGGWHIGECRVHSGNLEIRLDGGSWQTIALTGGALQNFLGTFMGVGGTNAGTSPWYDGKVAFIGIRDADTDDTTAGNILGALQARYAL